MASFPDDDLADLLIKKEKELQNLGKLRISQLEVQIAQRDKRIEELQDKLIRIQDDFNYNLKLLEDRDADLQEVEFKLESLARILKDKDAEISELKSNLAGAEQKLASEMMKLRNYEKYLAENKSDIRTQLQNLKWEKDEEIRKIKEELERQKLKYEHKLQEKDSQINDTRYEVVRNYEDLLKDKEIEYKNSRIKLESEYSAALKEISRLKQEIERLSKANESSNILEKLKEIEEKYRSEFNEKDARIDELTHEVFRYKDIIRNLEAEITVAKTEAAAKYDTLNWDKMNIDKELRHIKVKYEDDVKFWEATKETAVNRIQEQYKAYVEKLQQKLGELEADNDTAQVVIANLREKLMSQEKTGTREAIEIQEKQRSEMIELEHMIKQLRSQLWIKENEIQNFRDSADLWKKKAESAYIELENTKKLQLDSDSKLRKFQEDISQLNTHHEDMINKLISETEEKVKSKIIDLETENDFLTKRVRDMDLQMKRYEQDLNRKEDKSSSSLKRIWSGDLGSFTPPGESSDASRVRQLEEENRHYKVVINNMLAEIESIRKVVEEKDREILFLREKTAKLEFENTIVNMTKEKLQAETNSKELNSEIKRKDSEIQVLKDRNLKQRQEISQLKAERDQLIDISSNLKAELRSVLQGSLRSSPNYTDIEYMNKVAELEDQIQDLRSQLDSYKSRFYDSKENEPDQGPVSVLKSKLYKRPRGRSKSGGRELPNYERFEEISHQPAQRDEDPDSEETKEIDEIPPPANSGRETASQRAIFEKLKQSRMRRTQGVRKARNYNIREE
jgi:chromosome segregation ATPase